MAALAGLLLLIVGLLVIRPLLGGTDQGQTAPPPATADAAPITTLAQLIGPSTSVTASGAAAGSAKDPFKPLVSTGAAAAAGSGAAATPGGGSTTERQVVLISIRGGTAKVTVDGKAYSVTEGESFAGSYRAVDINSECASFESATTAFTLCEGEAVLK